jgi:hypothetical protein
MKKIIAISVMLVLIAGAVFADVSIGGQFKTGATLLFGNTIEKSDVLAGQRPQGKGTAEGKVNVGFGDANLGGKVTLNSRADGDYYSPDAFTFAWWKPTESFRIQAGYFADGDWGTAKITGWSFNGEAQDFVAIDNDSGEWKSWGGGRNPTGTEDVHMLGARAWGFYGAIKGTNAVQLSFYPSEALTINFGVPFGSSWITAMNQYMQSDFQIIYAIPDTGTVSITFDGQGAVVPAGKEDEAMESPKLFASFYLTAIEGIGVDIGVGFQPKLKDDVTTPPIQVGLGFTFRSDDFGVKLRLGAALAGKKGDADDPMMISAAILPYYNLGVATFYLNAGLGMMMPKEGDSITGWFFNPYIQKSVEGAKLFAGLKVYSNGMLGGDKANPDNKIVCWGVPIGINFYF